MLLRNIRCLLLATLAYCEAAEASGLKGTALDAARGVPLRNAQVLIASLDGKTEKETMTSASGTFTFEGLPAGRYFVLVNHYSNASAGSESVLRSRVIVSLDDNRTLEGVQLSPPPSHIIAGAVHNAEDDWPLSDAVVEALSAQYTGGVKMFAVRGQAVTDDLGRFRIRNLAPGSYYLRISRAPLAGVAMTASSKHAVRPRRVFEVAYYPGVTSAGQASPIHVMPGSPVAEVNVRLREVEPGSVRGQVCAAPGLPPASVQVGLYQPDAPSQDVGALAKFPANAAGEFMIEDLPPGTHLLCGSSAERPPKLADCAVIDTRESAQSVVKLCPRPAGGVTGRIRLASREATNTPEGLEVHLYPQDSAPMAFGSGGSYPLLAGGRFTAGGLVPGRYQLSLSRLPTPWYVESVLAGGSDVTAGSIQVSPGSAIPVEVVIAAGGGIVEGELKGNAIPAAAQVVLIPAAALRGNPLRFYAAEAGDDGRFRIEGVAPGSYTAVAVPALGQGEYLDPAWIARHEAAGAVAAVTAGQSTRADIALR